MSSDEAKANRRSHEAQQRRERERLAPPPREAPPPDPPEPGTVAWEQQQAEASRAFLDAVPSWESNLRREVDMTKARMGEACVAKYGRAPSLNPSAYHEPEKFLALRELEDSETRLIGATPENVEAARREFGAALLAFANIVTRGWPSKQVHEAQEARRLSPTEGGHR